MNTPERKTFAMRSRTLVVLIALASGCASTPSRVAMVVGHGDYQHAPPLANPANDANAVADRLRGLGWDVSAAVDLPAEELEVRATAFESIAADAEQVISFYAGHGMQVDGENSIVPVDFDPESAEVQRDLIALGVSCPVPRGCGGVPVIPELEK